MGGDPDVTPAGWFVTGARVTGPRHQAQERSCDDAWHWLPVRGGVVVAVADGAGSAEYSRHGAVVAVKAVCQIVQNRMLADEAPADEPGWRALMGTALVGVRDALERAADHGLVPGARELPAPVALDTVATTLCCVVISEPWLAVLHVGDGWAVTGDARGTFQILSFPDRGEYANETTFLTAPSYRADARTIVRRSEGVRSLALLTDGVETFAISMTTGMPFQPFFKELVRQIDADLATGAGEHLARALEAFLRSPRIAETSEDDKTLVIAVRADLADQVSAPATQ